MTTDAGERASTTLDLQNHEALISLAQAGGFWSYVAGTVYRIVTDFDLGDHSGVDIDNYLTTLPLKKGLSSSAAICVLVARAFNKLYGLKLSTRGEMQYAYDGERMTPSRCGKMVRRVGGLYEHMCMYRALSLVHMYAHAHTYVHLQKHPHRIRRVHLALNLY